MDNLSFPAEVKLGDMGFARPLNEFDCMTQARARPDRFVYTSPMLCFAILGAKILCHPAYLQGFNQLKAILRSTKTKPPDEVDEDEVSFTHAPFSRSAGILSCFQLRRCRQQTLPYTYASGLLSKASRVCTCCASGNVELSECSTQKPLSVKFVMHTWL